MAAPHLGSLQLKNVQARRAPAEGSIRPGLKIAEHLPKTPGQLSGTGRTDPNFIAAPLKGNLSKVSPRDSRLPSSASHLGCWLPWRSPRAQKGRQNQRSIPCSEHGRRAWSLQKRILVMGITYQLRFSVCIARNGGAPMKTLLIGIAIAVGMLVATRAVAASELTDCPHIVWKHGHYVCVMDDNG